MMLWVVLTAMTSAAAVWAAAPFLRRFDERKASAASPVEVYRDQLREVDREAADGTIDAEQAEAARQEIKRRMLAASRDDGGASRRLTVGEQHFAVVSIAGIVVLGSTILYANMGRPEVPSVARAPTDLARSEGQPTTAFRERGAGSSSASATVPVQPEAPAARQPAQAAAGSGASVGTVDDMIQRLVDRLTKEPGYVEGWRMLGWSYFATDRYAEAVGAYRKAVELQPSSAPLQAALGEALVRVSNGKVEGEAVTAFDKALAVDSKEPRARFYKGLQQAQSGNARAALDAWIALLGEATPQDTWAAELRGRITSLASELGVDITGRLPGGPGVLQALKDEAAKDAPPPQSARGPSAAQVEAAGSMTEADRSAMIRRMVDGLAARLEKSPRDTDGWIQLMRSRKALGEEDAARGALQRALAVFTDSPAERDRIAAAARQLGISN